VSVGQSPWDYYGAESAEDLHRLGEMLKQVRDRDGRAACITANIVMANADLRRMRSEKFTTFRALPIHKGFPTPWSTWDVVDGYKKLIDEGVFYPALHGFTHFSPEAMIQAWHDEGELGHRARLLFERDIPYLASLTPEFNFALLRRYSVGESFASEDEQRNWIEQGVKLFHECFGFMPVATCAPGYRANDITCKLWAEQGIKVAENASGDVAYLGGKLLHIPRTVFFEPALESDSEIVVKEAFLQAVNAVKQGKMIVICSHSINYIQEHLNKRDESLQALKGLLLMLLEKYPDLRFANDQMVYEAWLQDDQSWFKPAQLKTRLCRFNE